MRGMDKVNGYSLLPRVEEFRSIGHLIEDEEKRFKRDLRGNVFTLRVERV